MTTTSKSLATLAASVLLLAAASAQRSYDTDILRETFGYDESTRKSVPLSELHQGCPARDCIPSIDEPRFVSADEADYLDEDDIVLAISWKGDQRAYPARILDQHEIVNDVIGGTAIAITYCPLCGSAVGVLREIDGSITEFGVSGLLYNSDLVFYDRATETLWEQIGAEGIVGPLTGERLELVPVTMTRWGQWRSAHPDTLVLSNELGTDRDYTRDYYAKYRQEDRLMFPVSRVSDAIRPKTVVYGFELGERSVAFTEELLDGSPEYRYSWDDADATVRRLPDGSVELRNEETGETHAPVRLFWFAWYTFHPDTDLVR